MSVCLSINKRLAEMMSVADSPRETWSATLRFESTYLHCIGLEPCSILVKRFATKAA